MKKTNATPATATPATAPATAPAQVTPATARIMQADADRADLERANRNAVAEKTAQGILRKSLFALYHADKAKFLQALQFDAHNRVERFETAYLAEDENGNKVQTKTGIKFTVFNLWGDDNDPARAQRKAINAQVRKVADLATATPCADDKKTALDACKEVARLLGFADLAEKMNATDAKKVLVSAYRLTDNGKDDARDAEVRRVMQAVLWKINAGAKGGNARAERAKTADAPAPATAPATPAK